MADNDEFSDAFAEAVKPVEAVAPPAPPPVSADSPAASAVEAPAAAAEPLEPVAAAPAPVEPPAPVIPPEIAPEPAKAAAAPQISDDELLKRFASLVRQPPAQAERAPEPAAPAPAPPMFTDDESKFLASYEKDWPDVARAEALRRRADMQVLANYIFQEIAQNVGPVMQTTRQLAEQQQVANLRSYAPDYDQIREQVISWVDKQPSFLKSSMKNVISNGTYEEVTSLMGLWRQSNPDAAGQPAPVAPAPKPVAQISDAARKAAAALAPVGGKRSSSVRGEPQSFDDTWEEIARAG